MKYDDAEIQFLNFEGDLPQAAGGTHIGFYLAWMLLNGHGDDAMRPQVPALRDRTTTGTRVLFAECDGKLIADDLDDHGNFFSTAYYEAQYLKDYERVFAADFGTSGRKVDDFCAVADTWENYDRIAAVLDRRWQQWQAGQPFAPLVAPAKPTMNLSLEPIDDAAPAAAPVAAASATTASPEAPPARVSEAQTLLYAAPPLPDVVVEKMRQALSRFLGFEGFAVDPTAKPLDSKVEYALPLVAEFPGGWHWLELLSVDDRASGARPGWGLSLRLRSRPEKTVPADGVVDAPGFLRSADPSAPGQEIFRLPFEQWWQDSAALARTGDGVAYVPLNHPSELDAALEHLRGEVQGRLRPTMRQFEIAAVRAAR